MDESCSPYLSSFSLNCLNVLCSVIQLLINDHKKNIPKGILLRIILFFLTKRMLFFKAFVVIPICNKNFVLAKLIA